MGEAGQNPMEVDFEKSVIRLRASLNLITAFHESHVTNLFYNVEVCLHLGPLLLWSVEHQRSLHPDFDKLILQNYLN